MGSVGKLGTGDLWPVGLWFRPTDDELVNYHLKRKLSGLQETCRVIPELNIYGWEPQALFKKYDTMSDLPSDGRECFFYCIRKGKNRKTPKGFWKGIGKEHAVWGSDGEIGFKKIFVYHEGRHPYRRKSPFSMHEYHLNCLAEPMIGADRGLKMEIVLCRIINRTVNKTNPDSPSSECIDPDPVTPGAGAITNRRDDQANPQVWAPPLNLTETVLGMPSIEHDDAEMEQLLQLLRDDDEQPLCTCNDQFHLVGDSSDIVR